MSFNIPASAADLATPAIGFSAVVLLWPAVILAAATALMALSRSAARVRGDK